MLTQPNLCFSLLSVSVPFAFLLSGGTAWAQEAQLPSQNLNSVEMPAVDAESVDPKHPVLVYTYGSLSRMDLQPGRRDSAVVAVGISLPVSTTGILNAEVQHESRFGMKSVKPSLRFDQNGASFGWFIAASFGFGDPIKETWSVTAGVRKPISPSVAIRAEGRLANYDVATALSGASTINSSITIELHPPGSGIEFEARWIHLWGIDGIHRQGVSATARYYLSDQDYLFAGAATYPETERRSTRQMNVVHIGWRQSLSDRLGLRVTVEHMQRQQTYRQNSLTLGLELRF